MCAIFVISCYPKKAKKVKQVRQRALEDNDDYEETLEVRYIIIISYYIYYNSIIIFRNTFTIFNALLITHVNDISIVMY